MRHLLITLALCLLSVPVVWAGDLGYGLSVDAEKKLAKGLKAEAEVEVRTQNAMADLERWAFSLGLSYRLAPWLKTDAGYTFIDRYHTSYLTGKGNTVSGDWSPRHRGYLGLTGQYETKRWKWSLRERYQYTCSPLQYVPKHRPDGKRLTDEEEPTDHDHVLRSRLRVSYNIRHSKFQPYASVELISDLTKALATDQTRLVLGTDYKLDKKTSLSVQWQYKDRTGSDDNNGHLITVGYNHSF